jgi:O-antigen/teichoic acid export membrane protein
VKLQDNKAELKRFFLYIIKYISLITFPIGVFLFTAAEIFITTVLGDKWSEAVPVVQFVSVYGTIGSITFVIPTLTRAIRKHNIYLRYLIVFLFVMTPLYIYAVPYGLKAISAVHLLLAVIFLPYIFNMGMGLLNIKLSEIIDSLWVSIVISIAIGVSIHGFTIFSTAISLSQTTNVFIILSISIFLYIALLYLISRDTFLEFIRFTLIAVKGEEK